MRTKEFDYTRSKATAEKQYEKLKKANYNVQMWRSSKGWKVEGFGYKKKR